MHELPPTAGLRLNWSDFVGAETSLERGLADYIATPWIRVMSSGTASLVVALETLKRIAPRRNEVVIPGFTCPLVAIAVVTAGLRVRVCDLRSGSPEIDQACLASVLSERTLCIIPAHLGGLPADMEPIVATARSSGAFVVEDAAQSLGARRDGHSVGLAGDIGVFSLSVGKGLTTYEGGVLVAKDPRMREVLQEVSDELAPQGSAGIDLYELKMISSLVGYRLFYNPTGLNFFYGNNLRRELRAGRVEHVAIAISQSRIGRTERKVCVRAAKVNIVERV